MLIVAAAGNEGGRVSWPAASLQPSGGGRSYGLAVGATDADGSLASFSNSGSHLSLVAPGNFSGECSGVLVALPPTNLLGNNCYPQWTSTGGARYGYVAGTSFSTPEVAGVAALVWAARPQLTNYQVADIIKQSADRQPGTGWTPAMGCGQLDAGAAVELALSRSAAEWAAGTSTTSHPCSADGNEPPDWPAELYQSITFGTLADRTTADPDFKVHATASSSLPVTFTADDSCTVRGSVVHVTGTGLCTITASQAGNQQFNPADDVTQVFAITEAVIPAALPAFGKPGGSVSLRYRVKGKSTVTTSIVVEKDGKPIAHLRRRAADVESGHVYSLAWHAPQVTSTETFGFCVTLHDRTSASSYTSCARIRLSAATRRRRR